MTIPFPHFHITGVPGGIGGSFAIVATETLLFVYFLAVNAVDFVVIAGALMNLPRTVRLAAGDALRHSVTAYAPPVSVLIPAFNEAELIATSVRSLLSLSYPEHEVIVINDGSADNTLDVLIEAFELVPFQETRYVKFQTKPIRNTYRSAIFPNLRVIDKENGGKADALNAGINEARFPLVFTCDADTLYAHDALERMVQPFLEDLRTVACGANIGVLNEAEIRDGKPFHSGLPRNWMVRIQVLEYLRAFLTSRAGWAPFNGLMIISGACGLWKKDVIVCAGGFATNLIWEDLEMTVRIHHFMRAARRKYRIAFIAMPVCWTNVPENVAQLRRQRISWHRHLCEVVSIHRRLCFHPRGGLVEWFAFPNLLILESLAPIWTLGGLTFMVTCAISGILSANAQAALMTIVFALTLLKAASALLLDEISFRSHRLSVVWGLFSTALLEQLGYRQLVTIFGLVGMVQFLAKRPIRGKRENVPSIFDPPYRPDGGGRKATAAAQAAAARTAPPGAAGMPQVR